MAFEKCDNYPENYFHYNRIILRCAGLWAPDDCSLVKHLYKIYAVFVFLFVNLYFTSTEFVSLFQTYKEPHELIKNVNFALTHFMGAIKCIFWFWKGNQLIKIMNTLESKEYSYESSGTFIPGRIFAKYKRTGAIFTISFFLLAHMTLSSSYLPPLIATLHFMNDRNYSNKTFEQKLPYFSWMPFSYNTAPNFLWALGYQAGPMFSYAYSIVGMDTLFMNIMNFIVAHLCVIQGAFRTNRMRCSTRVKNSGGTIISVDGLKNSEALSKAMLNEMKRMIKHLQTILG